MKWWAVAVFVLVVVIGVGMVLWVKSKNRKVTSESVVFTQTFDSGGGLKLADLNSPELFYGSVTAPRKPAQVQLRIHDNMPNEASELMVVVPGSDVGPKGGGIGCSSPQYSDAGRVVVVDFYATPEKLIESRDRQDVIEDINRVLRKCLVWSAWGNSVNPGEFARVVGEQYDLSSESNIVELDL